MSSPTDNKKSSNITIAFIGPYRLFPGLKYNGSLIISGYEQQNVSIMSSPANWGAKTWWYWNQIGAQFAIDNINKNPNVLPNTTIVIKRFNDYCKRSNVCGGSAMTTAQEIYENHPDVVAVFGDFYGSTVRYSAQVYSQFHVLSRKPVLLDKNKYPYFFQTITVSGIGQAVFQLLKFWNVKRVAIISESSHSCDDTIINPLIANGIEIVENLQSVTYKDAKFIADSIERVGARYLIYCGGSSAMGNTYLTLKTKLNRLVGPDYVWFTLNGCDAMAPPSGNATKDFGKGYSNLFQGIIQPYGLNLNTPGMTQLQFNITRQVNIFQAPWGWRYSLQTLASWFNTLPSHDCTALLAYGMDQLLRNNPSLSLADLSSRALQKHMNYTAFMSTGLTGLTGDPLTLTENGDTAATFIFQYFNYTPASILFGYTDSRQTKFQYASLDMKTYLTAATNNTMVFFGGGSIPPPDGPIYTTDTIDPLSQQGEILTGLSAIGIAISVSLLLFVLSFRKQTTVKSGSIIFLSILAIGSIPAYTSILLSIGDESVFKCSIRPWLQLVSLSIILGCLIVKNGRVCMVYNAKSKISKKFVSDSFMLFLLGMIVAMELILLGIYHKLSRLRIQTEVVRNSVLQKTCTNRLPGAAYILWIYNCLLIALLVGITYASRNVGPNHSEVTLLITTSAVSIVVGILVVVLRQDTTSIAQTEFATSVLIWVAISTPIVLNLFPRAVPIIGDKTGTWVSTGSSSTKRMSTSKGNYQPVARPSELTKNPFFKRKNTSFSSSIPVTLAIYSSKIIPLSWFSGSICIGYIGMKHVLIFVVSPEFEIQPKALELKTQQPLPEIETLTCVNNGNEFFRLQLACQGGVVVFLDFVKRDFAEKVRTAVGQDMPAPDEKVPESARVLKNESLKVRPFN
ncbi:periplasmic binding protein-like I [Obelidium mucronatum]|nr:periplasmic binding protein-like I [Obelidium mucronatum]